LPLQTEIYTTKHWNKKDIYIYNPFYVKFIQYSITINEIKKNRKKIIIFIYKNQPHYVPVALGEGHVFLIARNN
jgi:hypothetical protein